MHPSAQQNLSSQREVGWLPFDNAARLGALRCKLLTDSDTRNIGQNIAVIKQRNATSQPRRNFAFLKNFFQCLSRPSSETTSFAHRAYAVSTAY